MEFKRGFLNSEKGRDALGTDTKSKSSQSALDNAEQTASGSTDRGRPSGLSPASVGAATEAASASEADGSSTEEFPDPDDPPPSAYEPRVIESPADLHAPPPGIRKMKPGHRRFVFSEWPRGPKGRVLDWHAHKEYGKRTPNGNRMWGETLWDFYMVRQFPENYHFMTWTSGSRIAAFMREYGELDLAVEELAWADSEGDPKQLFPCDIGRLIQDRERQSALYDPTHEGSSIFLHKAPTLQARLPFHLLPEKLVVHDPWNTLSVQGVHDDIPDVSSTEKEDIIHVFELSLSEEGKKKQLVDREAAAAADKARVESDVWRRMTPSAKEPGPLPPNEFAIHAKVPPRPPRPTSIPEAHLYIRREDRCGDGNHSVVYFSELELPRWALVDDILCEDCWKIALSEEVNERDKAGTLRPDILMGEVNLPEIRRTVDVFYDLRDAILVESPPDKSKDPSVKTTAVGSTFHLQSNMQRVVTDEYIGPVAYVYPKISWQNPERGPVCEHLRVGGRDPPLTVRVKVCAKLSIQGDLHLEREAENYQVFPSYFFEHWSGYNLVYPIRDPTPCGALVPQFYGYYVPQGGFESVVDTILDSASASKAKAATPLPTGYLSPILLLEHCGVPIDIENLSQDDKHAAAALYQTFHFGGWSQNSMYARNVVVQPGPITEWPAFRGMDERFTSFRLIDFGRATPIADRKDVFGTYKNEVCRMFKLLHHADHSLSQSLP